MPSIPYRPTIKQLVEAYDEGFEGWIWNLEVEREWNKFWEEKPEIYAINNDIKDLHKKHPRVLLWQYRLKYDPQAWHEEAQTTGDCRASGSLVRMADGTSKEIQDIKIGEQVISGNNKVRTVVSTLKKPYQGNLTKVNVKGYPWPIDATPDHLMPVYTDTDTEEIEWKPISKLVPGDMISIPRGVDESQTKIHTLDMAEYCPTEYVLSDSAPEKRLNIPAVGKIRAKNGRKEIKRYIQFNDKLAWLLGLYLAEGSMDYQDEKPMRITYNLGSHREADAQQAKAYFKELFGLDVIVTQVPSKPTVIYVRVCNNIIAALFAELCPGNTYTKRVGTGHIWTSPENVRVAYFKGWLDGDGHISRDSRISGCSVSDKLAQDMFLLANSSGIRMNCKIRPAYKQSKEARDLTVGKECNTLVYPDLITKVSTRLTSGIVTSLGLAVEVTSVEEIDFDGEYVYCIGVEKDHSFISDGYAVHNCVSHGSRNARDVTRAVEIARGDSETYHRRGATEPTYGARGHGGQGMDPSRATKFEMEFGFLFREVYKDVNKGINLDLSKYNSTIGSNWGRSGVPAAVKEACKQYKVGDSVRAKTKEEAFDLFANGNAAHSGQSWGTGARTGKDGINRKSAAWSHDMCSGGYDLSCEFFKIPVVFVHNSWEDWNEPNPVWMANQDVYGPWVPGTIVMDVEEWERYFVNSGSIQFYSEIQGFPVKDLPSMNSGVL